ncbi:MAG: phosphoribulokinase [Clostridia bacterium]|nr:phosphoribulokinase [Clostridia bacterium]
MNPTNTRTDITNDLWEPLLTRLDRLLAERPVILAIEGGSASGKSTLAAHLEERYGCTVFHMDDFFLRPEQRTPKRFAEAGGNVDRERFLDEVLRPLAAGKTVYYSRFNCSDMTLLPPVEVEPRRLTVVEGAYSMHPDLRGYYDLSVFLNISPTRQRARIEVRNPDSADRFFERWIPLERRYFDAMDIQNHCDLIIDVTD